METTRAIEILSSLADGRDPATGEQFPPDSPYQQADTVRALFVALEALSTSAASAPPRDKPPRRQIDPNKPKAGGPWAPEEEQQLRDAFAANKPISEIAVAHGRTPGAITARLVKLGLLDPSAADHPGLPRRSPLPQPGMPRLPSEALAEDGRPVPTPASSIRQNRPPASNSPAQLTQEEKDNLPF